MTAKNYKAGIFVLIALVLLGFMVVRVGQGGGFFSDTYELTLTVESAAGLAQKTPVHIAGVPIGVVSDVRLDENSNAQLVLEIEGQVKIWKGAEANVKTTGILGDSYIEIVQPFSRGTVMEDGEALRMGRNFGDLGSLTDNMSLIADDIKAITEQMRKLMAGDNSAFDSTVKNLERITGYLARNESNVDVSLANIKAITENLNAILAANRANLYDSTSNIADITSTINKGEGTVGRLIKDDETLEKIHDSLDNLNNLVGGINQFDVRLGGHTEYLGGTESFKNYVALELQPRPDKFFLFEIVSDPDPGLTRTFEQTNVTSGGTTSTITTERAFKEFDGITFSAQFAKKFHDFTLRGGLIESTGGLGLDYNKGPFSVKFSAFDFRSEAGEKPHLKAWSEARISKTFYIMGGFDDFINPNQDLDWFMGMGLSFSDGDIRNLLGVAGAAR